MYVFGDGTCSTSDGPGGSYYYGHRYSNGRIWVEVLSEWQGITYDGAKNWSWYGHYSSDMVNTVSNLPPPADASTALFVVWACDADFVKNVEIDELGTDGTKWTNAINRSLTNHFTIITNLYAKGARTLIMPNAVNLIQVPHFSSYASGSNFIYQQTINFNGRLSTLVSNAVASLPGLTIYSPDIFSLLDTVLTNPTNYGLIKPHTYAIGDLPTSQWQLNGPGTNYVFWDDLDPTAKFHMWVADTVQRLLPPVQFTAIASVSGSNRLDVVNVPVGRNGFVEFTTNFLAWTSTSINVNTNFAVQSIFVPRPDPQQFYRVRFPFAWWWP